MLSKKNTSTSIVFVNAKCLVTMAEAESESFTRQVLDSVRITRNAIVSVVNAN